MVRKIAGVKPTAVGLHDGLPGAGEGMIDDPSVRNSSDAGGNSRASGGDRSSSEAVSSSSAETKSGDSSAGDSSDSSAADKSNSGSSKGSGEAADADDNGAGQLPRREANRLEWTISPPNLSLARTRGQTRRLAEADSSSPIDDIALKSGSAFD